MKQVFLDIRLSDLTEEELKGLPVLKKTKLPNYWKLAEWDKVENNLKWKHDKLLYHSCEIIPMSWCGGYWDNKKIAEGYKFKAVFHSRQHRTKYFFSIREAKKYCYKWLRKVNEWNGLK